MDRQLLPSVISLSSYLRHPFVRTAWRGQLPRTSAVVLMMNKTYKRDLLVPPSQWVRVHQRYGCLGTAYDYLVGTIWAGETLQSVLERVQEVSKGNPRLIKPVDLLKDLLGEDRTRHWRRKSKTTPDFYRALGALADLDAMFRASVPPPPWVHASHLNSLQDFRAQLRLHYPDEFVEELKDLFAVTVEDLPRPRHIYYNPVFGGWVGRKLADGKGNLMIGADGDLLLDDLLLELKISVRLFTWDQLWQLLGYAALDRTAGQTRIRRVGIYNPRYRVLWQESLEDLIQHLGGGPFDNFCRWFTENADQIYLGRIFGREQNGDEM